MSFFSFLEYKLKLFESRDIRDKLSKLNEPLRIHITSFLICDKCNTLFDENNECFCFLKKTHDCVILENNGILTIYFIEEKFV